MSGGVLVVMQVYFDLTTSIGAQLAQHIEMLRLVLLDRIEEGVLNGSPIGICECARERWQLPLPAGNAYSFRGETWIAVAGFVVVTQTEKYVGQSLMRPAAKPLETPCHISR